MSDIPPSVRIVEKIAELEGVHPTELEFCLWDCIDPDAIDALCAGDDSSICLEFAIQEYTVTVASEVEIITEGSGAQR